MKVAITGSLGLTGSACMEMCKKKGWTPVGVDANMRSYFFGTPKQEYGDSIELDIRNQEAVEELFKQHKFDAIIHTAAQPSHDWAKNDPLMDFDTNARATLILLEATRKYAPDAIFVHVSTDKVYGENMTGSEKPFTETLGLDFAGVRSLFGCSKAASDMYAQEYANYFGMKVVVFRPGCITGKVHQGAEYHGFLAYLAKCIKEGITYKVHGDGKQVRDQIHASDLADAFGHVISDFKGSNVYNIGGGPNRSVSLLEAVDMIEKETGKKAKLEFGFPNRRGDRLWDVHDVTKFRSDYPDWDYQYSLQDIIKELSA